MTDEGKTFDLSEFNQQVRVLHRSHRRGLIAFTLFLVAFMVVFSILVAPLGPGAPNVAVRWFGVILVVVVLGYLVVQNVRSYHDDDNPPSRIRISSEGVEFDFGGGRTVYATWSDAKLAFELYDVSSLPPSELRIGSPFSIYMRPIHSILTEEAFQDILKRAQALNLVDSSSPGYRGLFAGGIGVTHKIRHKGKLPGWRVFP